MGLGDIGFPTFETNFKSKKKKSDMDIGIPTFEGAGVNSNIWDYGNPMGKKQKQPRYSKGRKQNRQNNSSGIWDFDMSSFQQMGQMGQTNRQNKRAQNPKTVKIQGKKLYQDPSDPENYLSEKQFKSKYHRKGKTRVNRPVKNYNQIPRGDNVLINTISGLNERLARRSENKRYEQSQRNISYEFTYVDKRGNQKTEVHKTSSDAHRQQNYYRRLGFNVSPVQIIGGD